MLTVFGYKNLVWVAEVPVPPGILSDVILLIVDGEIPALRVAKLSRARTKQCSWWKTSKFAATGASSPCSPIRASFSPFSTSLDRFTKESFSEGNGTGSTMASISPITLGG